MKKLILAGLLLGSSASLMAKTGYSFMSGTSQAGSQHCEYACYISNIFSHEAGDNSYSKKMYTFSGDMRDEQKFSKKMSNKYNTKSFCIDSVHLKGAYKKRRYAEDERADVISKCRERNLKIYYLKGFGI